MSTAHPQAVEYCPEEVTQAWQYYAGEPTGYVADADAKLRCSDCVKFPAEDECGEM